MRNPRTVIALVAACLLSGCGSSDENGAADENLATKAQRIARQAIIVDGHIDVPYRLVDEPADVSSATENGDFDYPRAVSGGLDAPFMSIYTPAGLEESGEAFDVAEDLIDGMHDLATGSPDKFALANSVDDVFRNMEAGLISLPLGMENGAPIEGRLENVAYFHERGIRYITLTHSLSNHISDSSYDDNRQWGGLSDFGIEVVEEMNRVGIMVDISHVSDEAFYDVIDVTKAPVIASHSSVRHFTPDFERNMSDAMIEGLAENGGVIMINFGSSFISAEARQYTTEIRAAMRAWMDARPDMDPAEARSEFVAMYTEEHGEFPYATLDNVLDHFDHVVDLVGVDHVGIGSDYDGVGDSLPIGLKDVSSYPNLIEGLLKRGYSESDVVKILGGNLLRVWSAVETVADRTGSQ